MDSTRSRALIYGAGNNFIYSMNELNKRFAIVGVADGSDEKQGTSIFGFKIGKVNEFPDHTYDYVIVTPSYTKNIVRDICALGIDRKKIIYLEDALKDDLNGKSLRAAIIFYGGLGDYIIGKNWLYHLHEHANLEGVEIDAYFSEEALGNARAVFADSDLINDIRPIDTSKPELMEDNYQLVISFSIFPMIRYLDHRALFIGNPKLYSYASDLLRFGAEHYERGFFASPDFYKTVTSVFDLFPDKKYHAMYDVLDTFDDPGKYHCSYSIDIDEDAYLEKMGLERKKYITVNTGVNTEYLRKPSTRTWSHINWLTLIDRMKESVFGDFKIVRMGLSTQGDGETKADIDLCGKTSIEEAKVLLKNARLHIDYEGGLVHLRHVLEGGPSVVLHGPTSIERYGYLENIAVRSAECPKACEWAYRDWLVLCHNGDNKCACMRMINVEDVAERVFDELNKDNHKWKR